MINHLNTTWWDFTGFIRTWNKASRELSLAVMPYEDLRPPVINTHTHTRETILKQLPQLLYLMHPGRSSLDQLLQCS